MAYKLKMGFPILKNNIKNSTDMETKLVFRSSTHLNSNELLKALGRNDIKEITTTDIYNYSIDEGKVYECTLYEVRL
ncbi:hypothetical protein M2480_001773 [Parabacteroides sp. PFB2-12]|nr:hypothetical protein [Parabacteroides sp. PM6-13]MDH6390791.1 hypothetical protein [Parabacteroides sp. PFB2-12]